MSNRKLLITTVAIATLAFGSTVFANKGKERPEARKAEDVRKTMEALKTSEFAKLVHRAQDSYTTPTYNATLASLRAVKSQANPTYAAAVEFIGEMTKGLSEGEQKMAGAAARLVAATQALAGELRVDLSKSSNIDDAIKTETDPQRSEQLKVLAAMDTSIANLSTYMTSKGAEGRDAFMTLLARADQGSGVTGKSFADSFRDMINELVNCR